MDRWRASQETDFDGCCLISRKAARSALVNYMRPCALVVQVWEGFRMFRFFGTTVFRAGQEGSRVGGGGG